MAVGSGPAGPVLAGPIIFKVSNDHIVVTRKLNLFLRKSIKLLPPELLLLAQICTKSFVGWGFAPDPTRGAYSATPDPLAGLRGPNSKGRGGKRRRGVLLLRGGELRRGRGGDGKGGGKGEGEREGDGRTNPKPAATGLICEGQCTYTVFHKKTTHT